MMDITRFPLNPNGRLSRTKHQDNLKFFKIAFRRVGDLIYIGSIERSAPCPQNCKAVALWAAQILSFVLLNGDFTWVPFERWGGPS